LTRLAKLRLMSGESVVRLSQSLHIKRRVVEDVIRWGERNAKKLKREYRNV